MAADREILGNLGISFPFEETLSRQCLTVVPATEVQTALVVAELRFLYSTQFFAEDQGESALEHMREMTYLPVRQNRILDMQIRDELVHTDLLRKFVDRVGLDPLSGGFASGYTSILYLARSLAEKVFIFQIMTEAVSSAYLKWRLEKINGASANSIDHEIYADEIRHLKMGRSLLQMCAPDELKQVLTQERRRELIREMSQMCSRHFLTGIKRIIEDHGLAEHFQHNATDLDRMVARIMLNEAKSAAVAIEGAVHA